jgi:hypothetical protein
VKTMKEVSKARTRFDQSIVIVMVTSFTGAALSLGILMEPNSSSVSCGFIGTSCSGPVFATV